ncbi:MAG: hypothetical protein ABEN55_00235 [Bradymonadaceae bacterium]
MKKWMTMCVIVLASASLTLAACGDGGGGGGDTGGGGGDAGVDCDIQNEVQHNGQCLTKCFSGSDCEGNKVCKSVDFSDFDVCRESSGDAGMDGGNDAGTDTGMDTGGTDAGGATGGGGGCESGEEPAEEDLKAFSGSLEFHPVTKALDQDATLANAELSLAPALSVIGGQPQFLQDANCQSVMASWGSDFMEAMADWSIEAADVSGVMIAVVSMVGHLGEQPDDPKFLNTATGVAANPIDSDVSEATVYALTMETEAALVEAMASKSDNISSPGDLASQGFVLLQFLDADGNPMPNVVVTVDGYNLGAGDCSSDPGDRFANAYYPSSDFSSVSVGPCATTSDNGIAILPGARLKTFTGVNVETSTEFNKQQAASTANRAFVGFRQPKQ